MAKKINKLSRTEKVLLAVISTARRCIPIGNSYYVSVPKGFLEVFATRVEDNYYVKVEQDGNRMIITPITQDDMDLVSRQEAHDGSPR